MLSTVWLLFFKNLEGEPIGAGELGAGHWTRLGPTRDPIGVIFGTRYLLFLRAAVWHLLYAVYCMVVVF
jgi:hypothetical protein